MRIINGYLLEPFAQPESQGSIYYWPAVKVTQINGRFKATRILDGMKFNPKDQTSAMAAAERGIQQINSISVH